MRIMHVLKHCVDGNGGVHVAVDLACAQANAGHAVLIASSGGRYDDMLRAHGVEVAIVSRPEGLRVTSRVAISLLAIAGRFRPHVIHAHMMSSAVLGFGISMLVRAPLVTTVHNSFDKHSVIMRLGRVVVAVSEAERQLLLSRGYPARKVVTVLNGADGSPRETLDGSDLGPLARPCVVTLSGLHRRKAVDDVIRAFAEVLPEFPDWHLNVIGGGPDRERLMDMVTDLGLDRSVHFKGSTLTPRPLLEQADVFATATLADPCPLAVAEARAAGCAVVATAVGGIPELLEHGQAGQLIPASDPPAMAAAFRALMADADVLASWRCRAKQGAEHLTVRRMADDYTRVYESVQLGAHMSGAGARVRVAYFVPPSRHFAGIERVVHEIATGLTEAHGDLLDVHVLFSSRYDDDLLADTRYTLHVLDIDRLRNLAATLRARIRDGGFDVLVCPQVEASVIAWLATRGLRLPVFVVHLHGNPRVEEAAGSRCTRAAFSLFRHLVSRHVSAVLAVSPSLSRYAARSIASRAPVHFARNPVRDLGDSGARSPGDGRFRFVNIARLSRQKGQDILLRALAVARPDLPPVTLTLVGSGPDEAALRWLSSELGLDNVVIFAGYSSDPASYLRCADCFVLSSRWEGFGVVLVEALQFGLPLLATDCDFGPADVITDPRIGELVATENVEALAEGLKRAARRVPDPQDEAFRRAVAGSYARHEATETHVDVLRRIAADRRPRSVRLAAFAAARAQDR
jgi:glycosyltransferase involved in cell wall biosynthesis